MGAATVDGRPLAYYHADWHDHRVVLHKYEGASGEFDALQVHTYADWVWTAVNSQGLAYSDVGLPTWTREDMGPLHHKVKTTIGTIHQMRSFLDSQAGGSGVGVNYLIMDRSGKLVDFEVVDRNYWEYDPENPKRRQQAHFQGDNLFVARANAPFKNDHHREPDSVVDTWNTFSESSPPRYRALRDLFIEHINDGDKLSVEEMLEIDRAGHPGYDRHPVTRPGTQRGKSYTTWGTVYLGVKSGEHPRFTTMLVALGIARLQHSYPGVGHPLAA